MTRLTRKQAVQPAMLPSISRMLSDVQSLLAQEIEDLHALKNADPELASVLTKNALGRADILLKHMKSLELLENRKTAASKQLVDGVDPALLTDEQIRDLWAKSNAPSAESATLPRAQSDDSDS